MRKSIVILAVVLLGAASFVALRLWTRNAAAVVPDTEPQDGTRLTVGAERSIDPMNEAAPPQAPARPAIAVNEPPRDLDKIEAAITAAPDDPMPHYRKCQALFTQGREQEAVDYAAVALARFKAADSDLVGMILGSMTNDGYQMIVHYNMGPKERAEKKDGMVCPISFRVWTTDVPPKFVRILDFELDYVDGELRSAAIGENIPQGRANLGDVDARSDFGTIKQKVLEIITK